MEGGWLMASVMRFDEWQDSNGTPVLDGANLAIPSSALPSGSILQVVRATDTTLRTTASATFVDLTGMSVTITPTSTASKILVSFIFLTEVSRSSGTGIQGDYQIVNGAGTEISGGENYSLKSDNVGLLYDSVNLVAFDEPATTSAITYKLQVRCSIANTVAALNNTNTAQIIAMEVAG
jgi:hypothetical protein